MIEEYELNILLNPSNLFDSVEEVTAFLQVDADRDSLLAFLKVCEAEELYEYCELIIDKINEI